MKIIKIYREVSNDSRRMKKNRKVKIFFHTKQAFLRGCWGGSQSTQAVLRARDVVYIYVVFGWGRRIRRLGTRKAIRNSRNIFCRLEICEAFYSVWSININWKSLDPGWLSCKQENSDQSQSPSANPTASRFTFDFVPLISENLLVASSKAQLNFSGEATTLVLRTQQQGLRCPTKKGLPNQVVQKNRNSIMLTDSIGIL